VCQDRLPPAVTIGENIREPYLRHHFACGVHDFIEPADESKVAIHVRSQLGQVIRTGLSMWNVLQHLCARVERTIHVCLFEFIGGHAGDGVSIMAAQSFGPVLFQLLQSRFCFRLVLGTIDGESGNRDGNARSKERQYFHVGIVTRLRRIEQDREKMGHQL